MAFKLKILLILIFIFVASCTDPIGSEDSLLIEDQANGVIFPLKEGYRWIYRLEETTNLATGQRVISNETVEIQNIAIIDDEIWFDLISTKTNESIFYRNFDDGLYQFINGKKQLIIPFPTEVGFEWERESFITVQADNNSPNFPERDTIFFDYNYEVTEINTEIIIDTEIYNCIVVEETLDSDNRDFADANSLVKYYYFSFNKGLVREKWVEETLNNRIETIFIKNLIENNF